MNVSVGTQTDPGRRPNNEDLLAVVDVRAHALRADAVLIVADGMGGRSFGERAAREAVDTVQAALTELLAASRAETVPVSEALASALRRANSRVYDLAARDPESRGMGTTCVVAVVAGDRLHIAHAGDSRAYLFREGQMHRLTDDHSYVAEQVRAGMLTEEGARRSRFRNVITRAVGIEPAITPDVSEQDVHPGDRLLICTDGLSNMVEQDTLAELLSRAGSPQEAADRLVAQASRNGGTDNITAIVARLDAGNRTQRMKADDLARLLRPQSETPNSHGQHPPDGQHSSAVPEVPTPAAEEQTPTVRPAPLPPVVPVFVPMAEADAPPPASSDTAVMARPDGLTRPPASRIPAAVLSILCVLLAGALWTVFAAVRHDGYKLQAAPPFVVKPLSPPPPRPPDLAHMAYQEIALLTPVPIRNDVLSYSAADNAVTCVSQTGQVLRLRADGQTLTKYALPSKYLPPPAPSSVPVPSAVPPPAPPVSVNPVGIHTASDTQGNLYVADALHRTVAKYAAGGDLLVSLAPGRWQGPGAVAVGTDGTVFVADAGRLKILHAYPRK